MAEEPETHLGVRRLAELGEWGWIHLAAETWRQHGVLEGPQLLLGLAADDAALVRLPTCGEQESLPRDDCALVVTTDAMVEGVHFRRETMPGRALGHKALAVNLSDVAAMGARPLTALVTLSAPGTAEIAYLQRAWAGMAELAALHGMTLAGGDTTGSPGPIVVNVTALGVVPAARAWRADLARAEQLLCVTGSLGAATAGLAALERWGGAAGPDPEKGPTESDTAAAAGQAEGQDDVGRQSELVRSALRQVIQAHRWPVPRLDVVNALAPLGARACRDVSDGLAITAHLLSEAAGAGTGVEVDAAAVPIAPATRAACAALEIDPLEAALFGGEDYELAFTCVEEELPAIGRLLAAAGIQWSVVGRLLRGSGVWLRPLQGGGRVALERRGFRHFGGSDGTVAGP